MIDPFPRGFVWTADRNLVPSSYVEGLWQNLYTCRTTQAAHVESGGKCVAILGLCVGVETDIGEPCKWLHSALLEGDEEFFKAVDLLCGRFVVFFDDGTRKRLIADATAMRSVFYLRDFSAVASHARILSLARPSKIPFRHGFPGNGTPFSDVKLLTANTCLDLTNGRVERFWPRNAVASCTPEEAGAKVLAWAATAMRQVAKDHEIRVALTAGLDSRALLAAALASGVRFSTYTYGGGPAALLDASVARDLAAKVRKPHTFVPIYRPSLQLSEALKTATYAIHHHHAVAGLREWYDSPETIAVSANLLEIGRNFYQKYKGVQPPVSAESARTLHLKSMSSVRSEIRSYPREAFDQDTEPHYRDFFETSDFNAARDKLSAFDQFYWEHRMSAWHGVSMLERDFYAQAFIPFNARVIFETLLGVPEEERTDASAFYSLIGKADARLLQVAINPKEWPLAA